MARILYDSLLTEAGLDLLTEAGDTLVIREIGMAGDATATGGSPGTVVASGRILSSAPPVTPPAAIHFIPVPAPLRGRCTVAGQAGTAAGRGRLTLVGKAATTGQPGVAASQGTLTLVGAATLTASPARLSGRGDAFDELALILALAA